MVGPLKRHRLKDNEALRVTPPVQHLPQLPHQYVDKTPTHLPAWSLLALRWRDREFTPKILARPIICDPVVQMCVRIPVNPVSVDLLET